MTVEIDGANNIIKTNSINEVTSANGITIDGLNIKDSKLVTANSVIQTNITDQAINEAKMQISNAPTNGYALTAQSGNTGGMTWATVGGDNTPYFRAYRNGTQSVSNGSYNDVQFNAETFDPDNKFNTSNYRFTPAVSGFYVLTAQVRLGVQAGGNMFIGLRKNGSTFANALNDNSDNNSVNVISIVESDSDDYFDVQFFQSTGQTRDITGGDGNTFFTGFKIIT